MQPAKHHEVPTLTVNDIHLWRINLEEGEKHLERLAKNLAPDELKTDAKYQVCRGALRQLLSAYLMTPPRDVTICYTSNGKPFTESGIHFSVSHKHQLALIAVTRQGPIGIDLEYKRSIGHLTSLSQRFLSTEECHHLQHLIGESRLRQFFEIWVKKEAYTKLVGGQLLKVMAELRNDPLQKAVYKKVVQDPVWLNTNYVYTLATNFSETLQINQFQFIF